MKATKIAFIWVAIFVFLGFSSLGALGAFGVIEISNWSTAAAIVGPCIGICASVIGAKHLFNDPDATTELKGSHAEQVRTLEHQHADTITELEKSHGELKANFEERLAEKDAEINEFSISAINEKKKRVEAEAKYQKLLKPKESKGASLIASGSARTIQQPPPRKE